MRSKQDIIKRLFDNYEVFAQFSEIQNAATFEATPLEKWSVGQNLDHLNRAIRPINLALRLPKFLPRLLFGKAKYPSRTYEEVVAKYQSKLAAGAKASIVFVPPKIGFSKRPVLLKNFRKNRDTMIQLLEKWSETDLDNVILPHPILGKLTAREMLYFTIYHSEHHLKPLKNRQNG